MANQQNSYTGSQGTGTNNADFAFTFPSFTASEVKVEVDNVVKTLTTHYTVENHDTTSGGTVSFTAGNIPSGTTPVRIFRQTNVDTAKADFTAGSSLKAQEINDNFKQLRHALQEAIGADTTDRKVQRFNIEADAIDGTLIADDVINSEHYVAGSIDLEHMSANSVDSDQYVDGSIDLIHMSANSVDSDQYVDGSIDLVHMSANSVDSDQYVDGSIDHVHLANDAVDGDNIADDSINSEHYVDLSIDTQHIANEQVTTAKLAPDAVTSAKLADNSVNSEHYVDGSIDHEHLANDIIDGDNIQDDVINSEHYVAGSIDHEHLAADIVDGDNIADNSINSEHYVDGSIDHVHLANDIIDGDNIQDDVVNSEHIAAGALDNEHYAAGSITSDKLSDATVITASEQASATTNDTSFLTSAAADARFFNISTGDTIKDGDSFPDNDTTIATTAAINDRIIDLVDDVGGFVPIANETSFPTANPDVNNGAGTLVSIKAIGSSRTPSSGTVTIANGSGSNTVTITGCGSTVLAAGFGVIVETTTTLHTYAFHRLVPKATEVTTVAGKATEIGRLGTAAAVEDMSILGTADVVADLNTLGTADVVSDMNMLATSDVISDMNTLAVTDVINDMDTVAGISSNVTTVAGISSNVTTVAGISSNVTTVANNNANVTTVAGANSNISTVAGSIANVNTTASNIADVNNFAATYQIASSAPSTDGAGNALAAGDLYFDTSANELRVHNGTTFQGGVTATGNLAGLGANSFTGNQTIQNTQPTIFLTDTNNNDDYSIQNQNGYFAVKDETDGQNRFVIHPDGTNVIGGNLDVGSGLDVTGNITVSGNVDGRDVAADGTKLDGIESSATADQTAAEIKTLLDSNGIVNSNVDASAAIAGSKITPNFGSQGIDGGALTITGDVPTITFTDANNNPDYKLIVNGGAFLIHDSTNGTDKIKILNNAEIDITPNVDFANGIDVTGHATVSQSLTVTGTTSLGETVNITGNDPNITFVDSNNDPDFKIFANAGCFLIHDYTNGNDIFKVQTDGHLDITPHTDFAGGIDVTGHATVSQSLTVSGGYVYAEGGLHIENSDPRINLVDTNGNPDYHIRNSGGTLVIRNTTNGVNNFVINGSGEITTGGNVYVGNNLDVAAGADVTGNITVTGTVDGRDVATDGTKLDGIEASATADQTASEIKTLLQSDKLTNSEIADNTVGADQLAHTSVTAGSYGSATAIPAITVDAQGRITAASTNTVNTTTNLGTSTATGSVTVTSSTGNNATISEATSSAAGVMSTAHHDKLDGIASSANNYSHPNHSGEVTSSGDGAMTIADNVVDEANLKISNSPQNGYMLTAQSGNSGGLTWAPAAAGATGASNDEIFWENGTNVTADYTITNGKNAGSFGPITIDSGVTVTVGSGETWTVV